MVKSLCSKVPTVTRKVRITQTELPAGLRGVGGETAWGHAEPAGEFGGGKVPGGSGHVGERQRPSGHLGRAWPPNVSAILEGGVGDPAHHAPGDVGDQFRTVLDR